MYVSSKIKYDGSTTSMVISQSVEDQGKVVLMEGFSQTSKKGDFNLGFIVNAFDQEGEGDERQRQFNLSHLESVTTVEMQNGLYAFCAFSKLFQDQKIASNVSYLITSEGKKEEDISNLTQDLMVKLPLPIEASWAPEIAKHVKITQLDTLSEDERVFLKAEVPQDSELEEIVANAYKNEQWLKFHKRVPKLRSVREGVMRIQDFNLKSWMLHLKKTGGLESFQDLYLLPQKGIVSLFEIAGDNAAKARKVYGDEVFHTIGWKGLFTTMAQKEGFQEDLSLLESKIEGIKQDLEKKVSTSLSTRLKMAIARKNRLLERDRDTPSTREIVEKASQIIKISFSEEDKDSSSLMKQGVENVVEIILYMKENDIFKLNRKNLRFILNALKYKNVRHPKIAEVCSRAKVSQQEFEIYQNMWDQYQSKRSESYRMLPTISGEYGDWIWEMCDSNDENILVAGNETNCCQHPTSLGGPCVKYMMENPSTSTIFRLYKKNDPSSHAQSFFWITVEDGLMKAVFDNIEARGSIRESILECYKQYWRTVAENFPYMLPDVVLVGGRYNDVEVANLPVATDLKASIPGTLGYTDARGTQYILGEKKLSDFSIN